MTTTSSYNDHTLTITVKGSVNGSEAPQFQENIEKAINACDDKIDTLAIDASLTTFISSSGLRVLLQLRSHELPIRIFGCSPEVFNVFRMTGFNHIFEVEQALQQTSIEGLTPIEGLEDTYLLNNETMIKVFPKDVTKEDVDREVAVSKYLLLHNIPTPMTFDIKKIGDRFSLVYERVTPCPLDADTLGKFIHKLHDNIIEPDGLIPSAAEQEKKQIQQLEPYLGEDAIKKLLQILSTVPEGSCLLHGNITVYNVFQHEGTPMFFNNKEMTYGNPNLDLAHLYSALPKEQRGSYFDTFINSYYNKESKETIARNRQNIITLSIIRDFTRHIINRKPSPEEVEEINNEFKKRVLDNWEELLSHLHFKMDFSEEIRKLERKRFYLDGDVDIDWIANKLGTNRHYVSDYFNKVLHTTFNDYINGLRLDYAVQLIQGGKSSPTQIAFDAGFNNDHTFRRLFKERYGCTPSQYK